MKGMFWIFHLHEDFLYVLYVGSVLFMVSFLCCGVFCFVMLFCLVVRLYRLSVQVIMHSLVRSAVQRGCVNGDASFLWKNNMQ